MYFHQSTFGVPDGVNIFYEVRGDGAPAAILCDGLGCDGFVWKYLKPILSEHRRVMHWHYRGHGKSTVPADPTRIGVNYSCDDLLRLMDHLKLESGVLFGHSMGTQLALEFHRQHPERVPDPQDRRTFERSRLRLEERREHAGVRRLYRELLALRRDDSCLRRQDRLGLRGAPLGERALAFGWRDRLVVANFGRRLDLRLPPALRAGRGRWRPLLSTDARRYGGAGERPRLAAGRLIVPAETTVLFAAPARA